MDRTGYDAGLVVGSRASISEFSVCPSVHMMGSCSPPRQRSPGTGVVTGAVYQPDAASPGGVPCSEQGCRAGGSIGGRWARLRPGRVREFRGRVAPEENENATFASPARPSR